MVTRAAKDLLRNTIRSTGYHNRLIEEDEMWRQWEVEKGLTMMVTDDYIRRRMRMDEYPKREDGKEKSKLQCDMEQLQKQKQAAREAQKSQSNYWTRKLMETEENDPDRWGHSGYKELYPEEFTSKAVHTNQTSSSKDRCKSVRSKLKEKNRNHTRKRNGSRSSQGSAPGRHKKKKHKHACSLSIRNAEDSDSRTRDKHKNVQRKLSSLDYDSQSSSESNMCEESDHVYNLRGSDSPDTFRYESDASESSLQKQRDYLKRKLEEADQSDSSDCVIVQVCAKHQEQKHSVTSRSCRHNIGMEFENIPSRKLKSHVVKKDK